MKDQAESKAKQPCPAKQQQPNNQQIKQQPRPNERVNKPFLITKRTNDRVIWKSGHPVGVHFGDATKEIDQPNLKS